MPERCTPQHGQPAPELASPQIAVRQASVRGAIVIGSLTNRLALMTDGDWRDGGFRQRRPSVETLAWVAASMGRGSRIVGYRRLTGGVCSAVNRLTVERCGMRRFVVLRQYPGGLGLHGSLEKEIANLGVVAGSGLPVPSILATDVAGASTGLGEPNVRKSHISAEVTHDGSVDAWLRPLYSGLASLSEGFDANA